MPEQLTVSFTIPGHPVAQGRPRFARRGKHVVAYDPKKSRDYKATVQAYAMMAMKGAKPMTGPLIVTIEALFACPKTDQRKRHPQPLRWHTKRPDADNIAKGVLDALGGGVVWLDDSQVVQLWVSKLIAAQGDSPSVMVMVSRIEENPTGRHRPDDVNQ